MSNCYQALFGALNWWITIFSGELQVILVIFSFIWRYFALFILSYLLLRLSFRSFASFFWKILEFLCFSICSSFGIQLCQNCGWAGSEPYVRSHITEPPCHLESLMPCLIVHLTKQYKNSHCSGFQLMITFLWLFVFKTNNFLSVCTFH